MTPLNFGELATIKGQENKKTIRVTGFWKFKPLSPIEDEFTRNTLQKLIDKDIENGKAVKEERIEPCEQHEAQLIGANSGGFYDVQDLEFYSDELANEFDFKEDHDHKLSVMKKLGEMGVYGRIKLAVSNYPRFFNQSGELLPEFNK